MVAGAIVGGLYGGLSDRESVMGGAMKGAALGGFAARYGGGMKGAYGSGFKHGQGRLGAAAGAGRNAWRGMKRDVRGPINDYVQGAGTQLFGKSGWNKMMASLKSNRGGK